MRFVGRRAFSRAAGSRLRGHAAPPNGWSSPSSPIQKLESSENGSVNDPELFALSGQQTPSSSPRCRSFGLPHEDNHDIYKPSSLLTASPSLEEVTDAVSSLTDELGNHERHLDGATFRQFCSVSEGGDVDWLEPSPTMFYPTSLQASRARDVYDAFHLLQTDPTVKKMVLSLSSDPAVWNAVMNNDVVRELRDKYFTDEQHRERSTSVVSVLKYIFEGAKAKLVVLYKNIAKVVEAVLKPTFNGRVYKGFEDFEDMMRISFFLSIFVLFVVIVTRSQRCC